MASLEELRDSLRVFARERDWEQFHTPKNLAMALAGEVGELVAEFQWLRSDESWLVAGSEHEARVRAEIGDVVIYLTRLADALGIDLVEAAREKLGEVARRYPAGEWRGRAGKAPSGELGGQP
jgi:NTP pyrophosphatase (non-canonical NTP hydrolase)